MQAWIERMARQMRAQRFSAQDLNEVKAWVLGAFLARILPGAWGGSVPPITLEGRHVRVDDYLERNRWRPLGAGDRFLDLGCGFPPMTTRDAARRFWDVRIVGADPSFGCYLVREPNGDYACFDDAFERLYFQPGANDGERWDALFNDPETTRERFLSCLRDAVADLPEEFGSTEIRGVTVIQNPVLEFATDNLASTRLGWVPTLSAPSTSFDASTSCVTSTGIFVTARSTGSPVWSTTGASS